MKREIVINHTEHEVRLAILENKRITEIYHEREKDKGVVGNIYKGKVLKVLPGMESAFVDIGLPKAAFLFVDDIRSGKVDLDNDITNGSDNNDSTEKDALKKRGDKSRKVSINELIKEGDDILVQVSKGPIGTKGARITCNISLPGRNLVLMPHVSNVGVSRQIYDEKERSRLKQIVSRIKPANSGFIVRTVATGRSEDEFKNDIEYLLNTWKTIESKFQSQKSPYMLYDDLNITFRVIRDMLSPEISQLTIDDENEYLKINKYLNTYLPKYNKVLKHFKRPVNIFDHYGIETELDRALGRKVQLKSGGHLIVDQSEALTAIDVNTGSFTGSKSHEETILHTNMEAARELVFQLRLRNIGGIIIIDFIDMENEANRNKVYQALKEELKQDKARSKILAISEIGLVEMTRKRDRENLGRYLCIPCPYCEGRTRVKSYATTLYEIYRYIIRISNNSKEVHNLILGVHPDVAEYIEESEKRTFRSMEKMLNGSITLRSHDKFHLEQYEILEL